MRKIINRLLIFFIGVPFFVCLVWFKQQHHFVLHIVITLSAMIAASELVSIFSRTFKVQSRLMLIIMSGVSPFVALLHTFFDFPIAFVDYAFTACIMICLAREVFSAKVFEDSNSHILTSSFIILYSGFFITFISKMTFFTLNGVSVSREILITFLLMVFMCDSLAWFFGVLFGKGNRGIVKASPNKSIAGFAGGIAGSILSGIVCKIIWQDVFHGSFIKMIILGAIIALASIAGDLAESVIKRSANCKDSGNIVPGRGGILDSIDSIAFSAPVYYVTVSYMFNCAVA